MSGAPEVTPRDQYNETLLANVHPPDWVNPDNEGGPTTPWDGVGTVCENQWIICR